MGQKVTGHRFQLLTYRILLSLEGMAANMKLVQCFLVTVMVVFVAGAGTEDTELSSPLLTVTQKQRLVLYSGEWREWNDAKTFCEKKGGMLATLETDAKFDEFLKLQNQKQWDTPTWIGGLLKPDSSKVHLEYIWMTGETVSGSKNPSSHRKWIEGEPTQNHFKKCLQVSSGGFSNYECDSKKAIMCQFSESEETKANREETRSNREETRSMAGGSI